MPIRQLRSGKRVFTPAEPPGSDDDDPWGDDGTDHGDYGYTPVVRTRARTRAVTRRAPPPPRPPPRPPTPAPSRRPGARNAGTSRRSRTASASGSAADQEDDIDDAAAGAAAAREAGIKTKFISFTAKFWALCMNGKHKAKVGLPSHTAGGAEYRLDNSGQLMRRVQTFSGNALASDWFAPSNPTAIDTLYFDEEGLTLGDGPTIGRHDPAIVMNDNLYEAWLDFLNGEGYHDGAITFDDVAANGTVGAPKRKPATIARRTRAQTAPVAARTRSAAPPARRRGSGMLLPLRADGGPPRPPSVRTRTTFSTFPGALGAPAAKSAPSRFIVLKRDDLLADLAQSEPPSSLARCVPDFLIGEYGPAIRAWVSGRAPGGGGKRRFVDVAAEKALRDRLPALHGKDAVDAAWVLKQGIPLCEMSYEGLARFWGKAWVDEGANDFLVSLDELGDWCDAHGVRRLLLNAADEVMPESNPLTTSNLPSLVAYVKNGHLYPVTLKASASHTFTTAEIKEVIGAGALLGLTDQEDDVVRAAVTREMELDDGTSPVEGLETKIASVHEKWTHVRTDARPPPTFCATLSDLKKVALPAASARIGGDAVYFTDVVLPSEPRDLFFHLRAYGHDASLTTKNGAEITGVSLRVWCENESPPPAAIDDAESLEDTRGEAKTCVLRITRAPHDIACEDDWNDYIAATGPLHAAAVDKAIKSEPADAVAAVFAETGCGARVGVHPHPDLVAIDANRAYTSCLLHLCELGLPVFGPFDDWAAYDNEPIRPLSLYIVDVDHVGGCMSPLTIIANNEVGALWGFTLLEMRAFAPRLTLRSVVHPCRIADGGPLLSAVETLYDSRVPHGPDGIDLRKLVVNIVIGVWGKAERSRDASIAFKTFEEAEWWASRFEPRPQPVRIAAPPFHGSEQPPAWVVSTTTHMFLLDGWRPLWHAVVSMCRTRMAVKAATYASPIYGINVDCIWVAAASVSDKEDEASDFAALRSGATFKYLDIPPPRMLPVDPPTPPSVLAARTPRPRPTVVTHTLENEFSPTPADLALLSRNKIIVHAGGPGYGKTQALCASLPAPPPPDDDDGGVAAFLAGMRGAARPRDTILYATPWNALKLDLLRRGWPRCTAATVHDLLGKMAHEDGGATRKVPLDLAKLGIGRVVFDEMQLNAPPQLRDIIQFVRDTPEVSVAFTGDPYQLDAIDGYDHEGPGGPAEAHWRKMAYYERVLHDLAAVDGVVHVVKLTKLKRITEDGAQAALADFACLLFGTEEERAAGVRKPWTPELRAAALRHPLLKKTIRLRDIPPGSACVTYHRSTAEKVGAAMHAARYGNERWPIGGALRCSSQYKQGKNTFVTNFEYVITATDTEENTVTLVSKDSFLSFGPTDVPLAKIKKHFTYANANTGHSWQGTARHLEKVTDADPVFVLADTLSPYVSPNWFLVAVTRCPRASALRVLRG